VTALLGLDAAIASRLTLHRDARGELAVAEFAKDVPFVPVRLFYIRDVPTAATRGDHAHKLCHQFLLCQAGRIRVDVFDGAHWAAFTLTPGDAVWIPPTLYATETFEVEGCTLLVLCDRPYEPSDYVNGLEAFARFRAA
jgi:UDP-2-acetamido-3-amino-2,3-dideoxy-glucuronate N-acetyltransferase